MSCLAEDPKVFTFWGHSGSPTIPVKLPPGVNTDEIAGPTPLPKAWNQKMKSEDQKEKEIKDLHVPLIDLEKEDDDKKKPRKKKNKKKKKKKIRTIRM